MIVKTKCETDGLYDSTNDNHIQAVTVRWSTDGWRSVRETDAEYVAGSSQGATDKFSFKLQFPCEEMEVGAKLQFCLRYECSGEFWDSNRGNNYVFQVHIRLYHRLVTTKTKEA